MNLKGRKFLKLALLGAIFSQAYAQELLLKEIEVKGKKESFEDSLEVREVRESSAKDVGEALTKINGLSKFRKGGIANSARTWKDFLLKRFL